jgi:hypothetical protein
MITLLFGRGSARKRIAALSILLAGCAAITPASADICGKIINTSWISQNVRNTQTHMGSFEACSENDAFVFAAFDGNVTFEVSAGSDNKIYLSVAFTGSAYPDFTLTLSNVSFADPSNVIVDVVEFSPKFNVLTSSNDSITLRATYGASSNELWEFPSWQEVTLVEGPPNTPPTADAGADQTIRPGDTVFLDGNDSFDDNTPSENLLYEWSFFSQPEESDVELADGDTATPSFTADIAGDYDIQLIVTDEAGLDSLPDVVTVSSNNLAPTADAGMNQMVIVGEPVTLNGMASSDPENDELSYEWSIRSAPAESIAVLGDTDTPMPFLTPDLEGVYEITLVVSDPFGPGTSDTVEVTATTAADAAQAQILSSSGVISSLTVDEITTVGNQTALLNFLTQAMVAIQEGDLEEATGKLENAIDRTDGCAFNGQPDGNGPSRDWITSCEAQEEIFQSLTAALDAILP